MHKQLTKTKSKLSPYPNKRTEWSYFMQAIEPNSNEINNAFPEYHPMWVIQSQAKTVSGSYFKLMREQLLKISHAQCAAYLRVTASTIQCWEAGKRPVPFIAFELLRLVYESVHFRLSHKDWSGWFIAKDGCLVSPDRGDLYFTAGELSFVRETHSAKSMYERENALLRAEVKPLRDEIARLQAALGGEGMLDELKAIEERLQELTKRVSRNKVIQIGTRNKHNEATLEEKVA